MSEELFDVVFYGILQSGKDKEVVMQNMAAMFKTDAGKLAPYFAGGRKVIKGKINAETAEKYQAALENVGLVVKVEEIEKADGVEYTIEPVPESTPVTKPTDDNPPVTGQGDTDQGKGSQQNPKQANENSGDSSGITVAPVGADISANPNQVVAQKIDDISDITMAKTGANVIENPVKVIPQKIGDINNISMADVGSDVLEHPVEVVPQQIDDISDISIAEAGADLIKNPKPEVKTDIPDTSDLSLDKNEN